MIFNMGPTALLDGLGILPTYKCTASCKDCCFECNPQITGRLSQNLILQAINEAADANIKLIVISGGECFLLDRDLDRIIKEIAQNNIPSRCVTNGYWAISEKKAYSRLKELKKAGLTEINFSTGDYHQEFVPVSNIINGCIAAISLGMPCAVMVEMHKDQKFKKISLLENKRIQELVTSESGRNLLIIDEGVWIPNKSDSSEEQNKDLLVNASNVIARKRCTSILSTFSIDPSGRIGCCCGNTSHEIPEMIVGHLGEHPLSELMNSALDDFMKIWLYAEGPEKIIAWAATKDPSIRWEDKYAHPCHACLFLYNSKKVRAVIKKYHHEKIPDVYIKFNLLSNIQLKNKKCGTRDAI